MRRLVAGGLFALIAVCGASAKEQPWAEDMSLLETAVARIPADGVVSLASYVDDLEKALARAKKSEALAAKNGIVLTDGTAHTLLALMASRSDAAHTSVMAVDDPYPLIGFYLGSYYNEIHEPDEALRVLDAGLALEDETLGMGETLPALISERGAALNELKRFADSLANFDKGLALAGLEDTDRARLYRGRGFALTELGRLDEAEEAYRKSLTCQPNHPGALNELQYIEGLRHGAKAKEPSISIPKAPPKTESTGTCATD